jgi:hypothetical protein
MVWQFVQGPVIMAVAGSGQPRQKPAASTKGSQKFLVLWFIRMFSPHAN